MLLISFTLAAFIFPSKFYGQEIKFSTERGFYNLPFSLTLASGPGFTLRYTTNGTAPTPTSGAVYTSPVNIDSTTCIRAIAYNGTVTSRVYTHTYIFPDQVIHQPATIPGWPNKFYSTGQGMARHNYEMDPAIVNSPQYKDFIKNSLLAIPTMSIVMDKDQFWKSYDAEDDHDIENPASVEVLYPGDPSASEQANCGLEAHSHKRLKRSLRLKFKSSYGDSKFQTRLLQQGPVNGSTAASKLDNLILRGGNNRSWARTWNPDRTCYTRDEWYRQSQVEASGFGPHGSFVHLYINGLYWGLYNPVERPDQKFSALYFGGSDNDWLAVSHDGVKSGDSARYKYLIETLINKDLRDPANYGELKQYLNIEDYCDYVIVTWMTGMTDWPANNFWGGNLNNPPLPFHYYTWDCEWSWDVTNGSNEGAWIHPAFRKNQTTGVPVAHIWNAAKKNPDFMITFADRVQKLCFGNGPLTDGNSKNRWASVNDFISDAIIAESARWGDALNDGVTRTKNQHWLPEVQRVDNLMSGNVDRFISALRNENYYPALDAPAFSSNGGEVFPWFRLFISNPNTSGIIYYTTDGTDPREDNGSVSPSSTVYFWPVLVTNALTVKARIKNGTVWSALQEASFTIKTGIVSGLYINEFMASNTKTLQDEYGEWDDWIEIYNSNSSPVNVGGLYITDNLGKPFQYQIPDTDPELTTVPPHGFLVLWADKQLLQGPLHTDIKLATEGEQIGLVQKFGTDTVFIDSISFHAQGPDTSEGRFPDGAMAFRKFTSPTPNASNTGGADNHAPLVYAGTDRQITLPSGPVILTATASDPDKDPLTYLWRKTSGPPCLLTDSTSLATEVRNFNAGTYVFSFTATDSKGASSSDSLVLTVLPGTSPGVISFTLINADTDEDIRTLQAQDTINLGTLPANNINIRANTFPATVGSVVFTLNSKNKTENVAPYSLRGDTNGDYDGWTPPIGNYTLKATTYSLSGGQGTAGTPLEIIFTVTNNISNRLPVILPVPDQTIHLPQDTLTLAASAYDPDGSIISYNWTKVSGGVVTMSGTNTPALHLSNLQQGNYVFTLTVTDNMNANAVEEVYVSVLPASGSGQSVVSFTLINADSDADIGLISNGDVINLSSLPSRNLNIRANTSPSEVGSVRFLLNGKMVNENSAPYALKGDNNGDYRGWIPATGNYTLSATPYSQPNGGGLTGNGLTVNFTFTNTSAAFMKPEDSVSVNLSAAPEEATMKAYPNPFTEAVNIEFSTAKTQYILLEIYNEKGSREQVLFEGIARAGEKYIYLFDGRKMRGGVYYSRLTTKNLVRNQRLLLLK